MGSSFLTDIGLVLGVAAITGYFARKIRLPSVLGYMMAGLVLGPYIPIPLFADQQRVLALSEFGVILVMFGIGIEFRIKRFIEVLPVSGLTAALQMGVLATTGVIIGNYLEWSLTQSLFLGGAIAISSTMIVSKIFEEVPPDTGTKQHVLGILVIQDLAAIILLTVLGTFAAGATAQGTDFLPLVTRLVGVFTLLIALGLLFIPRFVRRVGRMNNEEAIVIVATGICFALALAVEKLGYSVALGAFIAGVLVAESGEGSRVNHLIKPVRDVFAAIFFVSVGMKVNPLQAFDLLPISLLLAACVVGLHFISITSAGILSGVGLKRSLLASISLGQIGEFAFIMAAIGVGAGILSSEFQTIVVTVAVITSLCTPMLWRKSIRIYEFVDRHMPKRARMLVTLYETWFDKMRHSLKSEAKITIPRRILISVAIDAFLIIFLPPIYLAYFVDMTILLEKVYITGVLGEALVIGLLVVFLIPVLFNLVKNSTRLVNILADRVFPKTVFGRAESDSARQLFDLTLQTSLLLMIWLPLMAGIKAFVNPILYTAVLIGGVGFSFYFLWRRAGQMEGEITNSGQKIIDVLSRHSYPEEAMDLKVAGFGNLNTVRVKNPEVLGKTLIDVNLRAFTGATIVAIQRDGHVKMFPGPQEILVAGDIVHLSGEREARQRGKAFLG